MPATPADRVVATASGGDIAAGFNLFAEKSLYSNGVWTWFSDPRAVHYNGATYVGSITQGGSPTITKYVHATDVATQFILHSLMEQDDHNNPAVYIRDDGRIVCFYAKHNDAGGMRYRISTNPEDISAFDAEVVLSTNISLPLTYANPHRLSKNGKLYLFYRAGVAYGGPQPSAWSYRTTTDFSSWTPEQKVMQGTTANTPYYKMVSNGYDRIDIVATSQHPVQGQVSIYHVYMQLDASNVERWYKSDGTEITDSKPFASTTGTLVYDGSTVRGWIWEIAYGADGKPRILGTRYPNNDGTDIRYMYWRWTGSAWGQTEITTAGTGLYSPEIYYAGGICFDSSDPNTIYLSKPDPTVREIQVWKTFDDGATWVKRRNITSGSSAGNVNGRPYSPRNRHRDMRVVWWFGRYTTFTDYMTAGKGA